MGYRSEVAIVVCADCVRAFEVAATSIDPAFYDNFDRIYWSTHGKVFSADSIKWYAEYPVVRATRAGLGAIDSEDYVLTHLGENDDDVEREGYLDTAYIMRAIELPTEIAAPRSASGLSLPQSTSAQEVEIE